jgi:RNA polymerase sigma-70 factor (ECF subfamily)
MPRKASGKGRMTPGSDMPTGGEARLLAAFQAQDPAALDELYRLYGSFVHGIAVRVLRDAAAAEETTQDVFVYVWQNAARFDRERGTLASWLVTLARSRAIDRLRAHASQVRRVEGLAREVAAAPAVDSNDPLSGVLQTETGRRVRAALKKLPAEQRQALEVAYFEGLSHSEVAARLATPLGTVKTRIRQGMLRLREILESDSYAASSAPPAT